MQNILANIEILCNFTVLKNSLYEYDNDCTLFPLCLICNGFGAVREPLSNR